MVSTISVTFKTTIMTKSASKKQTDINYTEQALDILKKWYEQDIDNRGFIIITSERGEKVDDEYAYSGHFSLLGIEDILTAGLAKCMSHSDNPFIKVLNNALGILLIHKNETKQN